MLLINKHFIVQSIVEFTYQHLVKSHISIFFAITFPFSRTCVRIKYIHIIYELS